MALMRQYESWPSPMKKESGMAALINIHGSGARLLQRNGSESWRKYRLQQQSYQQYVAMAAKSA
jgi:hypothetical protein